MVLVKVALKKWLPQSRCNLNNSYLLKLGPLQWRLCKKVSGVGREAGTGDGKRKEGKAREKEKKKTNEESNVMLVFVIFIFSKCKSNWIEQKTLFS